ncbi:MAG: alpha/beta fold hydrolase [Candidatus Nanopelagicales bacterium]|nr:alpha/beta fold hydrolase [Candidatus Nanopelagicales bacterium]
MPLNPGAEPYTAEGDDLGVLVLHDFAGSPAAVKPWARHLANAGHTVATPRLPGHGTRWQDLNATTWQDWVQEAERSLDWLNRRCGALVVMGLSNGATIGLRLAERSSIPVAGIVAVNPVVHTERREQRALLSARRFIASVPRRANDIKRPGADEGGYDRIPLRAAHSLTLLWADVKTNIHRVQQPMLIYRSADDHVVEPSNTTWLLANAASDDVVEVMLENSFNVATLDNDAEEIFTGSLQFAERVAA